MFRVLIAALQAPISPRLASLPMKKLWSPSSDRELSSGHDRRRHLVHSGLSYWCRGPLMVSLKFESNHSVN